MSKRFWTDALRRAPATAVALVAITAIALTAIGPGGGTGADAADTPADTPYVARGYNAVLQDIFAPFGWLIRNEPDPGPDSDAPVRPIVTLADRAWDIPEVVEFLQHSFLRADIAANDVTRWEFDGDRVAGINPWMHNRAGPLATRRMWKGAIEYGVSDRGSVALTGGRVPILLRPATVTRQIDWEVDLEGRTVRAGDSQHGFHFVEGGRQVATVVRIGSELAVRLHRHLRIRATVIDPDAPAAGNRGGGSLDFTPLGRSGALVFTRHGDDLPVASYRLVPGALMSRWHPWSGRDYDPLTETIARPLAEALGGAARDGNLLRDGDALALTIDRAVHADAQRQLDAHARALANTLGTDFRAGATIMDAVSGEILALPSFPTKQTEPIEKVTWTPAWQTQNHNFVALPIGSMAKVPFAALILHSFPDMTKLSIRGPSDPGPDGGLQFRSVAGVPLSAPFRDGHGGDVDFTRFVAQSSNRYATTLMMLAAARGAPWAQDGHDIPPSDAIGFAGTNHPRAPAMALCEELPPAVQGRPAGRCRPIPVTVNFSQQIAAPPWTNGFANLLDMRRAVHPDPERAYDQTLWNGYFGRWDPSRLMALSPVSLQAESFEIDSGTDGLKDIRNDYLTLILGGGRSRWTTIKLAEAYSRIVTNRRVHAHLTGKMRRPELNLNATAHAALLKGMRAVVTAGTAKRANLPAPPSTNGRSWCAFAKTGTPTLSRPSRSPRNGFVHRLIANDLLVMRDNRLTIAPAPGAPGGVAALQHGIARIGLALPAGVAMAEVTDSIARINAVRARNGEDRLMFDVNGALTGLAPDIDDTVADRGSGLVLTIGWFDGQCEAGKAVRALTIAANIQSRDGNSNAATAFVVALLQPGTPAWKWLAAGGGQ